jgi:hypothetical protein
MNDKDLEARARERMDNLWVEGDCYCGTFRLDSPTWSFVSQGERGVLFIHTKLWCPDEPIHKLKALASEAQRAGEAKVREFWDCFVDASVERNEAYPRYVAERVFRSMFPDSDL